MNEPIDNKGVKGRYEKETLLHAGICLIGSNIHLFVCFYLAMCSIKCHPFRGTHAPK